MGAHESAMEVDTPYTVSTPAVKPGTSPSATPSATPARGEHSDVVVGGGLPPTPNRTTPNRHQTKMQCTRFLQPFRKKQKLDDTNVPTTSEIRQQELEQLRALRPTLSTRQMELIVDTWGVIQSDLSRLGMEMFTRLFETYPDVKGAFGPFKTLSTEDERYNQELRAHGHRVLHTVEKLVDLRNDPDRAVKSLHELGRKHVIFNAKAEYLDILGQQFLFAIEPVLKNHWNPEVEEAWAMLFKFMAHCMREAMLL